MILVAVEAPTVQGGLRLKIGQPFHCIAKLLVPVCCLNGAVLEVWAYATLS